MTDRLPQRATERLDALDDGLRARYFRILELLSRDPASLSSIRSPQAGWRVHIADSLSGAELVAAERERAREALRIADVGAGAGFPGLVLAGFFPDASVVLVESVRRKCEFMRRAIAAAELSNAEVFCGRSEELAHLPPPAGGRESFDVVTVRAVGRLATLAELAAPLLRERGALIAWKGRRDPREEAEANRAEPHVGLRVESVHALGEQAGAENRHIYVLRKRAPTPAELPRRAGLAKKRPFGAT